MPLTAALELRSLSAAVFDRPVLCPAGLRIAELAGSPACRCAIEQSVITAHENPTSLAVFCMGDGSEGQPGYQSCPSWRAQRDAEIAGRRELVKEAPKVTGRG